LEPFVDSDFEAFSIPLEESFDCDGFLRDVFGETKGFNSGKYDLNAVKEFLVPYLVNNGGIQFTIKRNNNTMCLKTNHLKFLDITNYLAPGFSYAQFLKAYKCPAEKGTYFNICSFIALHLIHLIHFI